MTFTLAQIPTSSNRVIDLPTTVTTLAGAREFANENLTLDDMARRWIVRNSDGRNIGEALNITHYEVIHISNGNFRVRSVELSRYYANSNRYFTTQEDAQDNIAVMVERYRNASELANQQLTQAINMLNELGVDVDADSDDDSGLRAFLSVNIDGFTFTSEEYDV